jgi:hypothetical protein
VVLEVFAPEGHGVPLGGPVLSLGSLQDLKVNAYLDPKKLYRARPGTVVTVRFPDGRKFQGSVKEAPVLALQDPRYEGRSVLVTVRLDKTVDPQEMVDSLPVTVEFPLCPDYLNRICGSLNNVFR